MSLLVCLAFAMLLTPSCEAKPVQFKGYPEGTSDDGTLSYFINYVENRNINTPFSANLFEGDMLVDPEEVKKIALAGGHVSMAKAERKRGTTRLGTWPNAVIPYTINPSIDDDKKEDIKKAMREWENGTCLSFVPFVGNGITDAYLKIDNTLRQCLSVVGYTSVSHFPSSMLPFGLLLNLGPSCYDSRVIRHELGHAIGFFHEQSRPDRDTYVKILEDNIIAGKEGEFKKHSNIYIDSLGSPYDLTSVMHYGPKAFSKNGLNTIEPVDVKKMLKVNNNISDLDKKQVNKLYNCV